MLTAGSSGISSRLAAVIILALATCNLEPAWASAPLVKSQAPGFHRMVLGDFELTALNDGVVARIRWVCPTTHLNSGNS